MTKKGKDTSKKANGEGTYEELASGWRYRKKVSINGVTKRVSFKGPTKRAAKAEFDEWTESNTKVLIEEVKAVGEWANHWVELYKKPA